MLHPKLFDYPLESTMLLLHLLVMTSALFGLSSFNESFHDGEDFVHSSEVFVEEMVGMNFQEPMVSFIFLEPPVTLKSALFYVFDLLLQLPLLLYTRLFVRF